MLLLFAYALAAVNADPTLAPALVYDSIDPGDYAASPFPDNGFWYVRWRATISPDGHIVGCHTVPTAIPTLVRPGDHLDPSAETKYHTLDKETCALVQAKVTYRPAIGDRGEPEFGIVYGWHGKWGNPSHWIKMNEPAPNLADLVVSVKSLPNKAPALDLHLNVVVDAHGALEHCHAEPSYAGSSLERAGCQQLALAKLEPAKDARGTPVRSVQPVLVRFVTPNVLGGLPIPPN